MSVSAFNNTTFYWLKQRSTNFLIVSWISTGTQLFNFENKLKFIAKNGSAWYLQCFAITLSKISGDLSQILINQRMLVKKFRRKKKFFSFAHSYIRSFLRFERFDEQRLVSKTFRLLIGEYIFLNMFSKFWGSRKIDFYRFCLPIFRRLRFHFVRLEAARTCLV